MPVIESTDNIIQLGTTGFCMVYGVLHAIMTRKRAWTVLAFAGLVYFLGIEDYISKPLNGAITREIVHSILHRSRSGIVV